ncbi:SRPBCC family protein [Ornithinimicrobium sp. LYQ121]|uniref:SRPBCC family protein n=1 Tax=Ornithinimicrobium sp. LYQ121 TaxID=3378801 RepID=UPI003855397A
MISWSESIDIDRPVEEVYNAVLDQQVLMKWSAWPAATGYSCGVDGDGTTLGSSIVFTSPTGEEMGRQTIVDVTDTTVSNRLRNRGPGGRVIEPEIDFRVERLGLRRSRVLLDFRVVPPVPAPLRPVARLFLNLRIRPLHRADLKNLRSMLETRAS